MYNFYQSKIRRDIQKEVYKNPTFDINLFGKNYFGVIKEKKVGPLSLKRYQVLGVELPQADVLIEKTILDIKHRFGHSYKNIFFQVGVVNEIVRIENGSHVDMEFKHDVKDLRLGLRGFLDTRYGLKHSFRENMPQAGIIYDVTKSDEALLKDMNESCRKRIKKAMKGGLEFCVCTKDQYEVFFYKWQETAGKKGFNTITYKQYQNLLKYITEGKGMLIGAFLNGELIAGTICLFDGEFIICPYGFYDRKFNTIGVQHFLKFALFGWARENGFFYVDTGGGAPTGFPEHELAGVTEFKESLGGQKIEYYGNYDVVLNRFLYRIFKWWYGLRK